MGDDNAEHTVRPPFGQEALREAIQNRINETSLAYENFISRLWAGHGAGATLVAGLLLKKGNLDTLYMIAFILFMLGLITLSSYSGYFIIYNSKYIRENELKSSIIDVKMDYIERPSTRAGLSIYAPKTITTALSAILFVFALIFCILDQIISCAN
ncbi:hypothetical protein [Azorhizobium doebereinerae]|uniref:hypothetical protein n=1 Tax=Azorhizobium doebereinerae TaxID=281091 RepID=UPI0012EB1539|nr:hypothetical protein [Azorhizobium doebereinerae]